MKLSSSDCIALIGIIVSLASSIVAIVISVITLRQNSKMIEESNRPCVDIYLASIYIEKPHCYLVVKNFGKSSALIEHFSCDYDLEKTSSESGYHPFKYIEHSTLMPQQSYKCHIDLNRILRDVEYINFNIVYSSKTRRYADDICVHLKANVGNLRNYDATSGKSLSNISKALQNMQVTDL